MPSVDLPAHPIPEHDMPQLLAYLFDDDADTITEADLVHLL